MNASLVLILTLLAVLIGGMGIVVALLGRNMGSLQPHDLDEPARHPDDGGPW